jgi:endonuclease/exonuclease/phosphatase (EEP) superfamily protein YafD
MTDIAAQRPLQRPRRAGSSAWSRLLWLLAVILLLCQATIWYQPSSPRLAVLDQFAVQLTGLALAAALLALVLRRWVRLAALLALAATLSWPIFAQRTEAAIVTNPERLKILSANVFYYAADHQRTLDMLMASDADIIGLVEMTPDWKRALAPLIAKYPYHVDCFDTDSFCEQMLLSKLPIVKPYAGRVWRTTPIIAGGEIIWNGRPITVYATHLIWPFATDDETGWSTDSNRADYLPGLPESRQAGQAANLAKFLNTLPRDLILMGDFNGAPWGRVQRAFRQSTGLDNQAGWDFSWPSSLPWPLRLPLDHILTRGHLAVTQFGVGPETESDHLPVIAEVGWRD